MGMGMRDGHLDEYDGWPLAGLRDGQNKLR